MKRGDVKDKLLNTLQLKKQADNQPDQFALIHASINQKITELKPVPFAAAVMISENRKAWVSELSTVITFIPITDIPITG